MAKFAFGVKENHALLFCKVKTDGWEARAEMPRAPRLV